MRIGMTRRNALGTVGRPATASVRWLTWCYEGGGRLVAAFTGAKDRSRAQLVFTDAPPFDTRGVRAGASSRLARRVLKREKRLGKVRGSTVLVVRERRRQLLVGIARGRVTWVGIAGPKLSRRGVIRLLRAAP